MNLENTGHFSLHDEIIGVLKDFFSLDRLNIPASVSRICFRDASSDLGNTCVAALLLFIG